MNLRVVHLLRKVERIDRDIEELEALLGTLQMDREYSARLRDSLVEESFRLRQLKQRINSQVIRIPPQFETLLSEGKRPEISVSTQPQKKEAEPVLSATITAPQPDRSAPAKTDPTLDTDKKEAAAVRSPSSNGSRSDKKKPPFLFRFE